MCLRNTWKCRELRRRHGHSFVPIGLGDCSIFAIVSDTGQTNNARCADNLQMKHTIEDVSRKDAGILVAFKDGVVAFFDPGFLYAQLDKRVLSSKTTPRQKKQE